MSVREWIQKEDRRRGWYASLRGDWWQTQYEGSVHTFCPAGPAQDRPDAFRDQVFRRVPEAGLACLRGAYLFSDQGAVLSRDNRLFTEFVHHFDTRTVEAGEYFRPFRTVSMNVERRPEWIALLAAPEGRNYYHWLFDVLPRLHLLEGVRPQIEKYALPEALSAVQLESLRYAGVNPSQIFPLVRGRKVYCERLLVPSLPGSEGSVPDWTVQFLRSTFGAPSRGREPRRKIYLSRADATERRVVNEPELITLLEARGFDVVTPGDLSFREQVRLFADADTVVGAHGAGLANLVFADDCRVVELFSPQYLRPDCYFTLCRQLGHHYRFLVGTATGGRWGDVTIHPKQLERTLEVAHR